MDPLTFVLVVVGAAALGYMGGYVKALRVGRARWACVAATIDRSWTALFEKTNALHEARLTVARAEVAILRQRLDQTAIPAERKN